MNLFKLITQPFRALLQNRELFVQFTKRNIELQHKGSHFGLFWSLAQPLLLLLLYVYVFGFIFGGRFKEGESRIEYGLGIFIGIICLHLVTEVIGTAPVSIIGNPSFVKKVVFPLEILPASTAAAAFFHFIVGFALAVVGLIVLGEFPGARIFIVPLVIIPVLLLVVGLAWGLASLGVYFRDIGQLVPFLAGVLLFSSAVFYSPSDIPSEAYAFLRFNPVMHFIDIVRNCMLWNDPMNWKWLGYLYVVGYAMFTFGFWLFRELKPGFSDVL